MVSKEGHDRHNDGRVWTFALTKCIQVLGQIIF